MNPRLARTILEELTIMTRQVAEAQTHNLLTREGIARMEASLASLERSVAYVQSLLTKGNR
jgi:hypothetical protein